MFCILGLLLIFRMKLTVLSSVCKLLQSNKWSFCRGKCYVFCALVVLIILLASTSNTCMLLSIRFVNIIMYFI